MVDEEDTPATSAPVTAELSEGMLKFMRSPDKLIESVHESVTLNNRAIIATTEIQFVADAMNGHLDYRYVDLLHPDKGLAVHVNIETEGVELASHREHLIVAQDAIAYRFSSIVETLTLVTTGGPGLLTGAECLIAEVRADLEAIPSLSSHQALEKLRTHFHKDGSQKWVSAIRSLKGIDEVFHPDNGSMQALYRLCNRLVYKYLLLVRTPTSGSQTRQLKFSVERPYSSMSTKDNKPAMLKRHVFFGSTPAAFRYHTPWAKRTAHYSFTAKAPHGQFFSDVDVISHAGEDARDDVKVVLKSDVALPFSWAASLDQGDRVNFFVGKARSWTQPLYVSLTHRELPGRSLLRVATLALTAFLLMGSLFALTVFFDTPIGDATAAILMLLALGGIASPWPRDSGPMSIPILSRVSPLVIAAITACYLVWLLTYDQQFGLIGFPGGTLWGVTCVLAVLAVLIRLGYRLYNQSKDYSRATGFKPVTGGTFH